MTRYFSQLHLQKRVSQSWPGTKIQSFAQKRIFCKILWSEMKTSCRKHGKLLCTINVLAYERDREIQRIYSLTCASDDLMLTFCTNFESVIQRRFVNPRLICTSKRWLEVKEPLVQFPQIILFFKNYLRHCRHRTLKIVTFLSRMTSCLEICLYFSSESIIQYLSLALLW